MANSIAITAQNTFCNPVYVHEHGALVITGTFVATVTLQCSADGSTGWTDTDTFTGVGVNTFTDYTGQWYRAGVKTGNFTSGTVNVNLRGE